MAKTILLGMNNPDPTKVFYHLPRGSSGDRILGMLNEYARSIGNIQFTADEYLRGFERLNVLDTEKWDIKEAKEKAVDLRYKKFPGRRIVIMGYQTLEALFLPRTPLGSWYTVPIIGDWEKDLFRYTVLPHPSGRVIQYNDKDFRLAAGKILYDELIKT